MFSGEPIGFPILERDNVVLLSVSLHSIFNRLQPPLFLTQLKFSLQLCFDVSAANRVILSAQCTKKHYISLMSPKKVFSLWNSVCLICYVTMIQLYVNVFFT